MKLNEFVDTQKTQSVETEKLKELRDSAVDTARQTMDRLGYGYKNAAAGQTAKIEGAQTSWVESEQRVPIALRQNVHSDKSSVSGYQLLVKIGEDVRIYASIDRDRGIVVNGSDAEYAAAKEVVSLIGQVQSHFSSSGAEG